MASMVANSSADYALGAAVITSAADHSWKDVHPGDPVNGTSVAALSNGPNLRWCFQETSGRIAFRLSRQIIITHIGVTRCHAETHDDLRAAPSRFTAWAGLTAGSIPSVWAARNLKVSENTSPPPGSIDKSDRIGWFTFDIRSQRRKQIFNGDNGWLMRKAAVDTVVMQFDGNWGNARETCIERIHVYGTVPTLSEYK